MLYANYAFLTFLSITDVEYLETVFLDRIKFNWSTGTIVKDMTTQQILSWVL